ncbi:hypothetical protein EXIGLDRAFT_752151 [Exidia glandulosa HHB12029]|uniref:F-box domain-containing protein n=1 Tax=Exidia glandulosa HHB12029 TaxID=1314781 RepID=A0A165ESG7_EXIGL|nr:hypothetical protein EXIGLDRAFT_752151 [Exidia glandulosa HHB12029]
MLSKTLTFQRVLLGRLMSTIWTSAQPKEGHTASAEPPSPTESSTSSAASPVSSADSMSEVVADVPAPASVDVPPPVMEDVVVLAVEVGSAAAVDIAPPPAPLAEEATSPTACLDVAAPSPAAPGVKFPFEIICQILLSSPFTLEELMPIHHVSRLWRDAVYAHPAYWRDIIYWPGERERKLWGGRDGWEDAGIPIPFLFLEARLESSSRPVRLHLSTMGYPDSELAEEVYELVGRHMHRFFELKLMVDVETALAPLLLALGKPAPMLQMFFLRSRKLVVDETRNTRPVRAAPAEENVDDKAADESDEDAADDIAEESPAPAAAAGSSTPAADGESGIEDGEDEAERDGDTDIDDGDDGDEAGEDESDTASVGSSEDGKVRWNRERALAPLPSDVFAGCAPQLVSVTLYDVSLTASTPYPAFSNVRALKSTFHFDQSQTASPGQLLSLFPALESLDLKHNGHYSQPGVWDIAGLDGAATPVRRLRYLTFRGGVPHEEIFTTIAPPEVQSLTLPGPSEETMRRMFSQLQGPLLFSVSRDDVTESFFWTISELSGYGRARTVEIHKYEWWAWGSHSFLVEAMEPRILESIVRLRLRASHFAYMAEIGEYWPSVSLVQIDILEERDVKAIDKFVPVICSCFPALQLLVIYWPGGPSDPTRIKSWANWVTVRFCGREDDILKQTAYVTDPVVARALFCDPARALAYSRCHFWSNATGSEPWGEYSMVLEHVKKLVKWKDDDQKTEQQRQSSESWLDMYINMPEY